MGQHEWQRSKRRSKNAKHVSSPEVSLAARYGAVNAA
jgi:hypothetical protein